MLKNFMNTINQFFLKFVMAFEYSITANNCLVFLVFFVIAVFLTIIILIFSYLLAKQSPNSEKLTSYECGFEPYEDSRHIFDVRFCVIAILFVIFDIEMLFLIPWSVAVSNLTLLGFWSMIDFLFELGVGFFYLLYVNALNWE